MTQEKQSGVAAMLFKRRITAEKKNQTLSKAKKNARQKSRHVPEKSWHLVDGRGRSVTSFRTKLGAYYRARDKSSKFYGLRIAHQGFINGPLIVVGR